MRAIFSIHVHVRGVVEEIEKGENTHFNYKEREKMINFVEKVHF